MRSSRGAREVPPAAMTTILLRVGPLEPAGEPYYPVQVRTDDPASQPWATARLPKCDADAVVAATKAVLLGGNSSGPQLSGAGQALLELVLRDGVATAWSELAHVNGNGTARALIDVVPEGLRALPWELVKQPGGRYLFLDDQPMLARGGYAVAPPAAVDLVVPVTVLVVVGNPGDTALRADEEVDAVYAALGGRPEEWNLEVLCGPHKEDFFKVLREVQPDVLHFLGHSSVEPHGGEAGLEIRPGDPDDAWWLTGSLVQNVVTKAPALVLLNACRTAAEQDAATGVAAAFAANGSQAVLAMQGDLQSASAVVFTRAVYEALAAWQPIDEAVRQGRVKLMEFEHPVARDWALPVLTVGMPPPQVLPICTRRSRGDVELLFDRYLDDARLVVDRSDKHRAVRRALDPVGERPSLVVVDGDERVGKSSLVQRCLHTLCLTGRPVVYADLDPDRRGTTLKWLNLLCHVRDAVRAFLPAGAEEPARAFDHALWFLRHGREPVPDEPSEPTPANTIWLPGSEHEPKLRAAVFAAFQTFLRAVAGNEPLVLAVDHLWTLDRNDIDHVVDGLFQPLARGLDGVRAVLVEDTGTARGRLPDRLRGRAATVKVERFTSAETMRVCREYGARRNEPFAGSWAGYAQTLTHHESWVPEALNTLYWLSRTGGLPR